jgi:hypothetical protein
MTHYARGTSITALTISLISASAAVAQLPPPPIRVVPNLNPRGRPVLHTVGDDRRVLCVNMAASAKLKPRRRLLFLRIEAVQPHVEGAATRRSTVENAV